MAKRGISVAELARQIGTTSRRLIDRCRLEGLFVQNSITKLNAEQERRVRHWFSTGRTEGAEVGANQAPSIEGLGSVGDGDSAGADGGV